MSVSNPLGVNRALDFEWNVFEDMQQAMDWYTLPSEPCVLSSTSSSPENVSYFNPDPNAFLPQNFVPSGPGKQSRGPKKSASSRTRRQVQNREAQRAFRIRQRQRFEDLESELHSLRSRYESLQKKAESADISDTVSTAESSRRAKSEVRASQVALKHEHNEDARPLESQQADVAWWLSAAA